MNLTRAITTACCGIGLVAAGATAQNAIRSVVSPADSSVFEIGDTVKIEWTVNEMFLNQGVVVEISFDGGRNYYQISEGEAMPNSARDMAWVVPDSMRVFDFNVKDNVTFSPVSHEVKLFVSEYDNEGQYTGLFAIVPTGNGSVTRGIAARRSEVMSVVQTQGGAYTVILPATGSHTLTLLDCAGRVLMSRTGTGPAAYSMPAGALTAGAYVLTAQGRSGRSIHRLTVN